MAVGEAPPSNAKKPPAPKETTPGTTPTSLATTGAANQYFFLSFLGFECPT